MIYLDRQLRSWWSRCRPRCWFSWFKTTRQRRWPRRPAVPGVRGTLVAAVPRADPRLFLCSSVGWLRLRARRTFGARGPVPPPR